MSYSETSTEELGRGYSADDLSVVDSTTRMAQLETRMPGILEALSKAVATEVEGKRGQEKLRASILNEFPGDLADIAFREVRIRLGIVKLSPPEQEARDKAKKRN